MNKDLYAEAMITATSLASVSDDTPREHIVWLEQRLNQQTLVLAESFGVRHDDYKRSVMSHASAELSATLERIRNL